VARILATAADTSSVEKAMAAASVRPDTEFREEDHATAPWHSIDICLQDRRTDVPARCPAGGCVTAKIDEYIDRLKAGNYDQWGAGGDLAFLIHLVGDIHQPLHAATDADRGGNWTSSSAIALDSCAVTGSLTCFKFRFVSFPQKADRT
jgi:hypothetical protein